jgi:hypothetical protein
VAVAVIVLTWEARCALVSEPEVRTPQWPTIRNGLHSVPNQQRRLRWHSECRCSSVSRLERI